MNPEPAISHILPKSSLSGLRVLIRGAGEMASGAAYRLAHAGFHVLMTEISRPLAVRRAVSYCEAVYDGSKIVEGRTARLIQSPEEAEELWTRAELPVIVDPHMTCRAAIRPMVIVDALVAKRNTGLTKGMAPLTIGLGPGFHAPDQVDLAIETNRGHNLGRLISLGSPEPNTGVPGNIAGYTSQRVLRSPAAGVFETDLDLGERVRAGQVVARVSGQAVEAKVEGILRGLLRPGAEVIPGTKVGDVDPRGQIEYLHTISEKARALGGSVLEGIMAAFNR
ncbi:MAG: EF2563 family selenium-dependent molybdenum hydroxylase system protein [Proteobacteria bacterium]|nr:EF2563 family selenium-dependent molybdenum hydroxylase system protein [Pseudomonadota bacterium]MBU4275601.1 EF2563 family selenium-dependent molybdenum hydroxylase system protein [Pseudomonadota bacterium]MBU4382878.1 EF2563 family selenium-dependent molybdenum hydroxylase system protein [Pseudomonadota bacterium]MBU4604666.1 EF2563 family selenium-dependent molybdenum hydroxylase system protein [Pseudomonadota bacterium]MCG2765393.1 EF2563 family selenium-dependent molybdenum hydroxylase 